MGVHRPVSKPLTALVILASLALGVNLNLASRHPTPELAVTLLKCSHEIILRLFSIILKLLLNPFLYVPNVRSPSTIRLPINLCQIVLIVLLVLIDAVMHLTQPVIIYLLLALGLLLRQLLVLHALEGLGI